MRLVCLGYGYSAEVAAAALGADHTVGTTRSAEKAAAMEGAEPIVTGEGRSEALAKALRAASHVIVGAGPSGGVDPFLATYAGDLTGVSFIAYLSTIGVYGDHGGAWIDETAPLKATSARGVERIAVEEGWLAHGRAHDIPVAVFRLAGIYGPGRNQFVSLASGRAKRIVKQGQVFNRIEVRDIGQMVAAAARQGIGGIFNGADNEPAPPQEVVAFAADLMGVAPPPEVPFETAEMSEMARSFYGDVKRCSNRKLRDVLGVELSAPTYREGLTKLWESGRWRG